MSKEIYEWLKAQKYQTEYEATGEYRMYFEVDMPKILEAYYEWKVKKLNKPAVSCCCGGFNINLIKQQKWEV